MRPGSFMLTSLCGLTCAWSAAAVAQTPWLDAGQQAMIMHQGNLLEQQTAPNNNAGVKSRKAPKPRGAPKSAEAVKPAAKIATSGKDDPTGLSTQAARDNAATSLSCFMARDRERLRPEYERRVREHGEQAATAWLREEASALGRRAAEQAKAGVRC